MPTAVDASQIPGAVQDTKQAEKLEDLQGEPMEITYIRQLVIPAKGDKPERISYVGEYTSLATEVAGEFWLPDRQGVVLRKFMQDHADTVFQGRWFKDPMLDGEVKRGWQFVGVDVIPEDRGNKAILAMSGKPKAEQMPF